MQKGKYNLQTWFDQRLEIRPSIFHGKGTFTKRFIQNGEVVIIWGGQIFTKSEVLMEKVCEESAIQISAKYFIGHSVSSYHDDDDFLNHSCDPNLALSDEVTLLARRDIRPGEELTIDYAIVDTDPTLVMGEKCRCNSFFCREIITAHDWRLKELQERYKWQFSPYINRLIKGYENRN